MTLIEAYKLYWKKAFVMKGRARRKEYWSAVLFNALISFGLSIIGSIIDMAIGNNNPESLTNVSDILTGLFSLAVFIPTFTITARRLQDIKINGWWTLLPHLYGVVILILGIVLVVSLSASQSIEDALVGLGIGMLLAFLGYLVVLLVFFIFSVIPGTIGPNKYGEDPKRFDHFADEYAGKDDYKY